LTPRSGTRCGWVALCDGDCARQADACEVAFVNTETGRCLRASLPELRRHRVVGFTDGLLVLLNTDTTAVRVLHPFTRVAVDFPAMAPLFRSMAWRLDARAWMRAFVCVSETSPSSIAVVVWFSAVQGVVAADPIPRRTIVSRKIELTIAVQFQGRFYGVTCTWRNLRQIYPQCQDPLIAMVPMKPRIPYADRFYLVESAARLMVAVRHLYDGTSGDWGFELFDVDIEGRRLLPVSSLGDRALLIGDDRCISVSSNKLPSISGDAIYTSVVNKDPVTLYSVASGEYERTSTLSVIHDFNKRIRPSVRPFTLADHLLTYCFHRHWSRGLMYHEYHHVPVTWKEVWNRFKAQDREVSFTRAVLQMN
ncbi:hypothetical protein EJB05_35811, partial [Eragrostis curvula]